MSGVPVPVSRLASGQREVTWAYFRNSRNVLTTGRTSHSSLSQCSFDWARPFVADCLPLGFESSIHCFADVLCFGEASGVGVEDGCEGDVEPRIAYPHCHPGEAVEPWNTHNEGERAGLQHPQTLPPDFNTRNRPVPIFSHKGEAVGGSVMRQSIKSLRICGRMSLQSPQTILSTSDSAKNDTPQTVRSLRNWQGATVRL